MKTLKLTHKNKIRTRTSRLERVEARISPEVKIFLQKAAMLSSKTLSDFLITTAQQEANRIISEKETISLNPADSISFVKALLSEGSNKPNSALKHAAARYHQKKALHEIGTVHRSTKSSS